MSDYRYISLTGLATYAFPVVLEQAGDTWFAYCPALARYGATASGPTRQEALVRINRLAWAIVLKLARQGESIPGKPLRIGEPLVVVTTGA